MVTAREFTLAFVFVFRLWVDSYSFRCRTSGFFATNASKYDLGAVWRGRFVPLYSLAPAELRRANIVMYMLYVPQATDYPCLRRVAVYEWLRGEWRDHNVHTL